MKPHLHLTLLGFAMLASTGLLAQSNAPANLLATSITYNQVDLKWDDRSTNETKFEVERLGLTGSFIKIGETNPNTPTYQDKTVTGLNTYSYRVRAVFVTNSSTYSNTLTVTTPQEPPGIVTGLTAATLNSNSIKLTWSNGTGGTPVDYQVERQVTAGGAFTLLQTVAYSRTPTFTDGGAAAGKPYCYRIKARNGGGSSGYSTEACATPPLAPTNIKNLKAEKINSSSIRVTWDKFGKESPIEIQRRLGTSGAWEKATATTSDLGEFVDNGRNASTQYCYRIAEDGHELSAEACATTDAPSVVVPVAPSGLTVLVISDTQLQLFWTDINTAPVTFEISRSDKPGGTYTVIQSDYTQKIFDDKGLTGSTQYCYKVRTKNSAGIYSGFSNEQCNSTKAPPVTIPRPPTNLTATVVSFGQIDLTWTDNATDESGFDLERSTDGVAFQIIQNLGPNAVFYSDKTVQPRTKYYYRVRAKNAAGPSANSNTVAGTTPDAPPAAPARLMAVAASSTQINLTWEDVSDNETNFQLDQSTDGGVSWKKLPDIPANQKSYTDTGLNPSTRYYYRLRAVNAVGQSVYATADAITLDKPLTPPAAPVSLSAVATSATQISLTWVDKADNEGGFVIERSPDGSTNWTKAGDAAINAVSFVDNGLTPKTTYFYRVRATNAAGPSDNSNTASATTPDVPPAAPARLTITVTSATSATLSWADVSTNETGFEVERGSSATGSFTKVGDAPMNATTFEDRGLTPATPYCYRIRAKNAVGNSAFSDVVCVATPDVPPAAPARLTVTPASPTQLNLAWTDGSTNESGFEIERGSTATGTFTKIADVPANATTYQDKTVLDNTAYCYRIRAKNAAGNSAYTDAVCATTPLAPPVAPVNLVAQVFDYDQVKLTWDAPSAKAVTVSIERSTDPNTGFKEIKQQPAAITTYIDMGLQEFTTYYYRIKAINAAGGSNYSNVATAKISEVPIAVEDELETHTVFYVNQRLLHITTNWFTTMHTTIRLVSQSGQPVLNDARKVNPADTWSYDLNRLPTGIYMIAIVADGRSLTKRILLP